MTFSSQSDPKICLRIICECILYVEKYGICYVLHYVITDNGYLPIFTVFKGIKFLWAKIHKANTCMNFGKCSVQIADHSLSWLHKSSCRFCHLLIHINIKTSQPLFNTTARIQSRIHSNNYAISKIECVDSIEK